MTLNIVVGLGVLTLGRPLFWLFVAAAGFAGGLALADYFLGDQIDWVTVAVAAGCGLVGALFAVFLQKIAIRVGGLIAGAYLAYAIQQSAGQPVDWVFWIIIFVGALAGFLMVAYLFDWALILLSAMTGAMLVAQGVRTQADPTILWILFGGLFVVGVAVQARLMRPSPKKA